MNNTEPCGITGDVNFKRSTISTYQEINSAKQAMWENEREFFVITERMIIRMYRQVMCM